MSERRLPQFIHIGRSSPQKQKQQQQQQVSAKANAAHPPPSTPPPKALSSSLFQTPTKHAATATTRTPPTTNTSAARRRKLRGILKSPSYKFAGIKVSPKKKKKNSSNSTTSSNGPTTPATVASCESLDGSDSISRTSSCGSSTIGSVGTFNTTSTEGIQNAIEKIINGETAGSSSSKTNDNDIKKSIDSPEKNLLRSASSSASVSSQSTSATSASTNSSTSKEELQRNARIKHIEDLKERIAESKARKLVERKAYRREDKLILRLARQLKTISKKARENAVNITILEENNQFCQECYDQCRQELQEYKASRILQSQEFNREMESKLEAEREQFQRVVRVQDAELEAHKRNHQYNCQALCESVLHANNDLDRMRALWEEHIGNIDSKGGKKRKTTCSSLRWVAILVALVITTIVVVSATTGGSDPTTTTTANVEENDAQLRSLPPLNMIRMGIIREEDTNVNVDLSSAFQSKTTTANDETIDTTVSDTCIVSEKLSLDSQTNDKEENYDTTCHSSSSSSTTTTTTTTTKIETTTEKQGEQGKRRRFKPKQVISNIFRK